MSETQRLIMAIFSTLTLFAIVAINGFPHGILVRLIGWVTVLTLFIASLSIRRKFSEQKLMTVALFFVVIADFILGLGREFQSIKAIDAPLGMLFYMIAYIVLIVAMQKNFSIDRKNLLAIVPIALVYIPAFFYLAGFIKGPMFGAAFIFGLVLCYMCWTALCCLFRGYFSQKAARLIAIAGWLIFISDLGVAFALFDPLLKGQSFAGLQTFIWITFLPAWTLILVTVAEENLHRRSPSRQSPSRDQTR